MRQLLHFFLSALGEGRNDKTLGIMKISGNDNSPVYILAISGTALNLFGDTTKLQKTITQQKTAWLKKKPKNLPDCHIADTYSIYNSEGAPTANNVLPANRVLAAEKLSKFQTDVEMALKKGVLPKAIAEKHQIGRNREKEMVSFLEIMKDRTGTGSEDDAKWHDIVKSGVSAEVVEEWMNYTADLISPANTSVSSSLRTAWNDREPDLPQAVLTFVEKLTLVDLKNISSWMFCAGQATASQGVWRKLLFPTQQPLGSTGLQEKISVVWGQRQFFVLACVVDFLQKCWCDDGLQYMTIGTGFLCCAEQNALEYAKRENLLRDKDFVQWTSARICNTDLVDEEPCDRCKVNFKPMVLYEMRSSKK